MSSRVGRHDKTGENSTPTNGEDSTPAHSKPLLISIHPKLSSALASVPQTNLTFLLNQYGAPYSAVGFGNWFRQVCDAAGLSGCSAHGLRHAAGRRLAEAGCTEHEIAAALGMSLRMVARYTAAADQERLAGQALERQLKAEGEVLTCPAATYGVKSK